MIRTAHLLVLLAASALPAQQLIFAEGPSAADLTLSSVDEQNPTAPPKVLAQNLELLPIEITNRTAQQALQTVHCRLVEHQGVRSVELPAGGSLYRYRLRGGQRYGFLLLERDGTPHFLLELPGTGASGLDDPFTDRIGVAPDGGHAAVLTAGGNLYALRLDGGTYASTGTAWRPVGLGAPVEPFSLSPGATMLFVTTADARVWRTPLADGGMPVDVTPQGIPLAEGKDELAMAGDGRSIVFLYGPKKSYSLWHLRETGAAVRLPPPPAKYEEPGYLPETPGGPRLLLNEDGSRLLYVDATVRDEIYLLDTSGATPTTHLTSDPNFEPYIGVMIFPVAIGSVIVVGIGDPGAFDVYAASTAMPSVVNLTTTAGNLTAPFRKGGLLPQSLGATGSGNVLAEVTVVATGAKELWRVGAGGTATLADRLRGPLTRSAGYGPTPDYLVRSLAGDALVAGADGRLLLAAPAGVALSTSVSARGSAFGVFLASLGGAKAMVFRFADGTLVGIGVDASTREVALTDAGGLAVNGASLTYASTRGVATLPSTAAVRWVLSGRATAD